MPKRKRQAKKKLIGKGRIKNAQKWLSNHPQNDLINAYSKRYGVNKTIAEEELIKLGFYDELFIDHYDKEGIDWEYRVVPTTGEMVVVPKESEESDIYTIHDLY